VLHAANHQSGLSTCVAPAHERIGGTPVTAADGGQAPKNQIRGRGFLLPGLVALSMLGVLAVCAAPAQAAVTHDYLAQLTEVPVSSGAPSTGPLSGVNAMTVDSGDLWVAEEVEGTSAARVDRFDGSGGFLSQLAQAPEEPTHGIAVGQSTGEAQLYMGAIDRSSGGEPEGIVAVFDGSGTRLGTWTGTPSEPFGRVGVADVAADNSTGGWAAGDVFVVARNAAVVDVFKPEAGGKETYITKLSGPELGVAFTAPHHLAVNQSNGELLVNDGSVIDVFEPTGLGEFKLLRRLTGTPGGAFKSIAAIAVDSGNGDTYVAESEAGVVDEFSAPGAYLGRLSGTPTGSFGSIPSVAIDPATHHLYVADRRSEQGAVDVFGPDLVVPDVTSAPVSELHATSATLNGTVNPAGTGEAKCQFVWGTSSSFGQVTACSSAVPPGETTVPVHAALSGLEPDTTYHYRLQASNAGGSNPGEEIQDQEFTTSGPGIREEFASGVTADSATLNAKLDAHGASTTYYFQYGTGTGYGVDVPAPPGAAIGSGAGEQQVAQHLQGLLAGTSYHYRVVAVSELAPGEFVTFAGRDETLVTQGRAENGPADGRAWEMVSPPDKHGAHIWPLQEEGLIQASERGDAISYRANSPVTAEPSGNLLDEGQVLSSRSREGWQSKDIETPNDQATGFDAGQGKEYRLFSPDLALAVLEPKSDTALSPLASEKTIYLRADAPLQPELGERSTYLEAEEGENGGYLPVVSGNSRYANVSAGSAFAGKIKFLDATSDLTHVVLSSETALLPPPAAPGLYEWVKGAQGRPGQLQYVSVLPESEGGAPAGLGSRLGFESNDVRHAISEDGSRITWFHEEAGGTGHIYLRDVARGQTVRVDAVQGGSGAGPATPQFQTAGSDGSEVLFTDEQQLTPDSGAGPGNPDLYAFSFAARTVTDLTPGNGRGGGVEGVVLGGSRDASRIYVVARAVLPGAANSHGEAPVSNADNLYLIERNAAGTGWHATFIATLSNNDAPDWGGSGQHFGNLGALTSRVSADGRYLAFMSERSLTGYDNRDVNSAVKDEEVFLYDANAGGLICASCNPDGARPLGVQEPQSSPFPSIDNTGLWAGRWLAANIPGWTRMTITQALYQSRYLSDGGRLFFNSSDALVLHDGNRQQDVYEYEPPAVGGCSVSSPAFSAKSNGCVGLISSGASGEESAFLDASASGDDVFFLTAARLAPSDRDTAVDVYDAHVCSEASPCLTPSTGPPPACATADSCRAAPALPAGLFQTPSSATFTGAGNLGPSILAKPPSRAQLLARALKECKKQRKRRRAACARRARARFGPPSRSKKARHPTRGKGRTR
jgi:hypothetical protein